MNAYVGTYMNAEGGKEEGTRTFVLWTLGLSGTDLALTWH